MKKINKKLLEMVECVTRNEVMRNSFIWPPICSGIFHQPKRPNKKTNSN